MNNKNNQQQNEIIEITKQMYYDENEKLFGDGFYPQLIPINNHINCASTLITFKYNKNEQSWIQLNNSVIYGFEGIHGIKLLSILNQEANVNSTKIINCGGRIIYPKIPEFSTYRALNYIKKI